jgi:uncharacterized damage-inducible protein DinB
VRQRDALRLFEYNYWANWKLLESATQATAEQFTAPASITWRNLRGTLVHTLDVERSWRQRLRGEDEAKWQGELPEERFATVAELETYWRADAREMLDWVSDIGDQRLSADIDLGPRDRFPLWYFLVHVVTHGTEQRRDGSIILKSFGHETPELEFLWFADSLGSHAI